MPRGMQEWFRCKCEKVYEWTWSPFRHFFFVKGPGQTSDIAYLREITMEGCPLMNWGGGTWLVADKEIIFIRKGNVHWCFIRIVSHLSWPCLNLYFQRIFRFGKHRWRLVSKIVFVTYYQAKLGRWSYYSWRHF